MIVNPREAEIVKRIYEDFLNGKGLLRISNDLNAGSIPKNSKGEPWNKNVVRYVLTNEKYIGYAERMITEQKIVRIRQ